MKLYLAIGHGIEPDGTYDPGAVADGLVEHDLAVIVVETMVAAFHRSGFDDFLHETSAPGHVDPDYITTVIKANAAHAEYVIEVHFNASGSDGVGHGSLVCSRSVDGPQGHFARHVATKLAAAVGLGDRGVQLRSDLWLLNGCTGHAIIPEVAFVDGDSAELKAHPELMPKAGEAMAEAFLDVIGHKYVAPGARPFKVHEAKTGKTGTYSTEAAALLAVRHGLHLHDGPVTIWRE